MSTSSFRCGGGVGVKVGGGVVPAGEVSHGDMLPPVVRLLKKTVVSSQFSEACVWGEGDVWLALTLSAE